jgi:hypothetical protein
MILVLGVWAFVRTFPEVARGAVRGQPGSPAPGGIPDARVAESGGRRRARDVDPPQPGRHGRSGEPRRMADDGGGAGVP